MTKQDLAATNAALDLVNISVRLYRCQRDLIDRAANLRGPDCSLSDYVRDVLTMQAALDLGVELPRVPDINRGRAGGMVAQAAAKLGMSREDFEAQAIRYAAAQALESDAIEDRRDTDRPERHTPVAPAPAPAPTRSTMRPAPMPGMYSSSPHAVPARRAR